MMIALAYTYAMEDSYYENKLHPLVNIIKSKILELINKKRSEGLSDEKLGELCGFSKTYMFEIRKQLKGDKFTLNAALKLWQGLGHPPETLIADCNVDPLLAERIKRIQESDWQELFSLVVNILSDAEYADPVELGEIKGDLKNLWRRIVKLKEQPPVRSGAKLSNTTEN